MKNRSQNQKFQHNVDLSSYNTLGVKANAERFLEIHSVDQLRLLYKSGFFGNDGSSGSADNNEMPVILGGGSNVLFKGNIKNPVLKISLMGVSEAGEENGTRLVTAGAGENWHQLVEKCVDKNLGGIENLALIPGTVGAAPIQNIGAYGVEFESVMESLRAFDIRTGEVVTFTKDECDFGYRDSIFKRELKGKVIITDVTMRLTTGSHSVVTDYYALQEFLADKDIHKPGIRDIFDAVVAIRRSKLPDPKLIGNAGSFFKNPIVNRKLFETISSGYSDMPHYPAGDDRVKVPAGWLIEQAGWKGKKIGNVGTYDNQALVIVNHGNATGEELYRHAMRIRESVDNMFGIALQPEVNIIGNDG